MPNAIKYSTSQPTGGILKSNVALGVSGSFGPTSTTGWYNGITPTPGKYIVFETDISFNPRIYAPQTDAELIRFVRSKGATGNNTASLSASLAWIGTQNNLMAANLEYENIVTSGLVLNLDAGFVGSYPTTGTSMYDLSGDGRNGTLTNGPTFNSANSGFIVFDYTNDFIGSFVNSNLGTPSTFTLSAWVRSSNISLDQNIFNANPPFFLRITSSTIRCCVYTGTWIFVNGSITLSSNTWYNLVLTYDQSTVKGYVNTVLDVNSVKTGSPIWGSLNSIGYTTGGEDAPSVTNIANAMIYNRALTAAEITQNFNAQKGRFGL